MNHKVLLADDSLTIQKVIKITLANEPYDLIECEDTDQLMSKLSSESPNMVFLDFNLSEEKSGYEVCSEITLKRPGIKVLMLFGTFDNIDDSALKECGAADKIIKPFDSNKFITICRSLVDEMGEVQEQPIPQEMKIPREEKLEPAAVPTEDDLDGPNLPETDDDDNWTVDSPDIEDQSPDEDEITSEFEEINTAKNALEASVGDWGAEVPGPIGHETQGGAGNLPPVIGSNNKQKNDGEPQIAPSDDDLEYPDMASGPSSKLVSLDELAPTEEIEEDAPVNIQLESEGTDTDEGVRNIEDQISDETGDDLWAADEFDEASEPTVINTESEDDVLYEDEMNLDDYNEPDSDDLEYPDMGNTDDDFPDKISANKSPSSSSKGLPLDFPRGELEEKLKPILEEYVKNYCRESIEKVAWEIIPDLAENLIKQELAKIADSIISDN